MSDPKDPDAERAFALLERLVSSSEYIAASLREHFLSNEERQDKALMDATDQTIEKYADAFALLASGKNFREAAEKTGLDENKLVAIWDRNDGGNDHDN